MSLGRDLGLTVVAEGIDDVRHWHLLATMGCDLAQGYLIAPGLRPAELERWLRERAPASSRDHRQAGRRDADTASVVRRLPDGRSAA